MRTVSMALRGVCAAALLALGAAPALAEGKHDRAETAIVEAQAKIDAADKVGAAVATPHIAAGAEAELKMARENLAAGHKEDSIAAAIHAGELADTALGEAQRRSADGAAAQANNAAAARADAANARDDAAAANARADNAEAAAANAQADAAAARAAPPVLVAQPQPTTTVTTETTRASGSTGGPARAANHAAPAKKPVHSTAPSTRSGSTETTKTTVTTTPN